jgi:hypothetical protein
MNKKLKYITAGLSSVTASGVGEVCIIGNSFCREIFGEGSYCDEGVYMCSTYEEKSIPCECGMENSFVGVIDISSTDRAYSEDSDQPQSDVDDTSGSKSNMRMLASNTVSSSLRNPIRPTIASLGGPTVAPTAVVSTGTKAPSTIMRSGMFVWAEWPSMWGEPDWISYYAKLVAFAQRSPLQVNKIILRVLDPLYGTVATMRETRHDLWTVSTRSVIYTNLLSKLPASVPVFEVYPYLMDSYNQGRWMSSMNTSQPLEAAFKYCSLWNSLLSSMKQVVRCRGVTVDGEERRGYRNEFSMVNSYKKRYGGLKFGYATGYSQVGVLGTQDNFTDDFYFELYDFYVRGIYPAQLVENSAVRKDDVAAFVSLLNSSVWYQQLPYFEHPKARFMWSVQNSNSSACLYRSGPTSCGIKQDFGAWSVNGFISFVNTIKTMFPTKFGNKDHGIFQFSFVPNSWITP